MVALRYAATMSGWHFVLDGEPTGPVSSTRLVEFCRLGVIDEDTLIWREGEQRWKAFSDVFGKNIAESNERNHVQIEKNERNGKIRA